MLPLFLAFFSDFLLRCDALYKVILSLPILSSRQPMKNDEARDTPVVLQSFPSPAVYKLLQVFRFLSAGLPSWAPSLLSSCGYVPRCDRVPSSVMYNCLPNVFNKDDAERWRFPLLTEFTVSCIRHHSRHVACPLPCYLLIAAAEPRRRDYAIGDATGHHTAVPACYPTQHHSRIERLPVCTSLFRSPVSSSLPTRDGHFIPKISLHHRNRRVSYRNSLACPKPGRRIREYKTRQNETEIQISKLLPINSAQQI